MIDEKENPLPTCLEAYRRITHIDPNVIGKRRGDWLTMPCVAPNSHNHGDENPSFGINTVTDKFKCLGCGTFGRSTHMVVAAGMASNLGDASKWLAPPVEKTPPTPRPPRNQMRHIADYEYTAAAGNVLYRVQRFEWDRPGKKPGKDFPQQRLLPDGKWDSRLGDVEKVPFHFPQMIYGQALGNTVVVVEGEKKVITLEKLGIIATTHAGGSNNKWTPELIECFKGGSAYVVIGDNDATGRAMAKENAQHLSLICGNVRLLEFVPGTLADGGDIVNWLEANPGATADDVWDLIDKHAVEIGVEVDDGSVTPMDALPLNQRVLKNQNLVRPSIPFFIPEFDKQTGMELGRVTVLAARTNQGKTAVAGGIVVKAARDHAVLVFSFEMGQEQWQDRMCAQRQGKTLREYRDGPQKRINAPGEVEWLASMKLGITGNGKDATIDHIANLIAIRQPTLVVVDHLRYLKGWMGGGKARADLAASEIMYAFPELAKKHKCHFLLLHQLNRQAGDVPSLEDLRDAGAVEEAADNVILLDRPNKTFRGVVRPAGKEDDIMHAHLAKTRESGEIFAHLVWHGPTMTARAWQGLEEFDRVSRCCTGAK
jgi:hypothetical protein